MIVKSCCLQYINVKTFNNRFFYFNKKVTIGLAIFTIQSFIFLDLTANERNIILKIQIFFFYSTLPCHGYLN